MKDLLNFQNQNQRPQNVATFWNMIDKDFVALSLVTPEYYPLVPKQPISQNVNGLIKFL
jgi:hypothetical protein